MLTFLNALLRTYLLAIAAIAVLLTGFAGHLLANFAIIVPQSTGHSVKIVIDSFLQAMQLFTLSNRPEPGADNWALVLGRLGGALVAFGAIGKVVLLLLGRARQRARLARLRGHAVLCGFGERGRFFAAAAANSSAVVALDTAPIPDISWSKKLVRLQGDARDTQVLQQASLARADTLVIGTGADERNLSIATSALAILKTNKDRPFELIVTLDDCALVDMIEREASVMRPKSCRQVNVTLFNPAREAALALNVDPLWARRALEIGQPRIRLAVLGATDTAVEVLMQFLRISPCAGLQRPEIVVFGRIAEAKQRLLARAPSLADVIDGGADGSSGAIALRWAVKLELVDCDPERDPVRSLLERLDSPDTLTAIIVAAGAGSVNIQVARNLRSSMEQKGQPDCPIHVHTLNQTSLDSLLRRRPSIDLALAGNLETALTSAQTPNQIIEPFGRMDALCRVGYPSSPREILARRLHEAHLATHGAGQNVASASSDSFKPWNDLAETYRRACRRAADQLPMKWLAANHLKGRNLDLQSFPAPLSADLLDALASMEHDSWRVERELDGWRHAAVRDNKRLLHPDLVPYDQLHEAAKEYNRNQIRALSNLAMH